MLATTPPRQSAIHRQAAAKINLTLHVTGKQADGYHLLDSLIVFAEVGDQIEVTPADHLTLEIDGPFGLELTAAGSTDDNLVMRAARMMAELRDQGDGGENPGAHIKLIKNLPIAAGVGGGSADAAATLDAVTELWGLSVPPAQLMALGLALGADVPACITGVPVQVSGIGDQMILAPALPAFYLVLVNPGIPLSTAQVFGGLAPGAYGMADPIEEPITDVGSLVEELGRRRNDLQSAAVELVSEIAHVLKALQGASGCHFSRMSGSGATCFGIFADPDLAKVAAIQIQTAHPNWWAASGAANTA